MFYGAASTLYRLAISIGIAVFLITVIPTLGWLLAAWLLAADVALRRTDRRWALVAGSLLRRWGPDRATDWRSWNASPPPAPRP